MGVDEQARATEGADGSTAESTDTTADRDLRSRLSETLDAVRVSLANLAGEGPAPLDDQFDAGELTAFDPPDLPEEIRTHATRSEVLDDVVAHFESADLAFDERPDEEEIRRRFFDFGYLSRYDEVERYWVNEPWAYVSIVRDRREEELRYRVTEPYLSDFEEYVLDEMTKILRNSLMYQDLGDDVDKRETFDRRAGNLVQEHTAAVTTLSLYKLLYYLRRDFIDYDTIDPIMHDEKVEDISCDGVDVPVFVYHREHRDLDTNVSFGNEELISFVARMAQRAGKHLSVSNPLVDASLPDGSRVQLSFGGDIATRGANFTIRQFTAVPDTPVDLVKWGTFSVEEMAYLWLAIENNRSLLFAGGTGSGKTTSLNAVSFFIPKKSKIVSIEDTPEIQLPHQNWVQSLTRESVASSGQGEVTMYQQLQSALRQRPEYILVGEIRTESRVALTFFQAMATGHTAYTTVHSESVMGVINRLENEPLSVPTQMIKELDVISIQKQVLVGGDRVRRNERITEIVSGTDADEILVNDVFRWDPADDSHDELVDSEVFDDVASDRGWTRTRIREEFEKRKEVMQYLIDEDVTWYEDVARTIHKFMLNPDAVLDRMRAGEFDPALPETAATDVDPGGSSRGEEVVAADGAVDEAATDGTVDEERVEGTHGAVEDEERVDEGGTDRTDDEPADPPDDPADEAEG